MERPLGAQISHMLKDRGTEVIFGIPGVHNQELYRGIEEAGLTHVLARHEQGAGFMADGYARATARPGVAYVITGPGVCNIMTPLGQAYSDNVPILVISSCLDETAATHGQLHQMRDQRAATATVCDWAEEARSAESTYALIDRALTEFWFGARRPKALQVPIALLETPAALAPVNHSPGSPAATPATEGLQTLATWIREAERPLFVFGGGAQRAASFGHALKRWSSASFVTYAGRGIVPADDPLHFGSLLARSASADIAGSADLVVAIGTELAETDLWRSTFGATARFAQINTDAATMSELARREGKQQLMVHGDCAAAFSALCDLIPEDLPKEWSPLEVSSYRAAARTEIMLERPGIVPVADALRAAIPTDTMIYSDMTQFAYAAKEVWDMDVPGHWHHPTGFGTLGYALPAAIGGAMGRPGKPTMAIAGDYGFQYTIQELATAVELKLSLPIILWDNGKLGEIEAGMIQAQIAPNAVIQQNPDFLKLAEAYGARSVEPESLSRLPEVLSDAFAAPVPTLIRLTPRLAG